MVLFTSARKSQIWSIEFIVALIIFISALFIFFKYSINLSNIQEITLKELVIDAKTVSNYLVSEGLPKDWNTSNVISIGLTDGNYQLNTTKLGNFSQLDYITTKSMFSVVNDYYIFFTDKNDTTVIINEIEGIGKPGINRTNLDALEDPSDVLKVFRFVLYNSTIIKMGIYVW